MEGNGGEGKGDSSDEEEGHNSATIVPGIKVLFYQIRLFFARRRGLGLLTPYLPYRTKKENILHGVLNRISERSVTRGCHNLYTSQLRGARGGRGKGFPLAWKRRSHNITKPLLVPTTNQVFSVPRAIAVRKPSSGCARSAHGSCERWEKKWRKGRFVRRHQCLRRHSGHKCRHTRKKKRRRS